MNISQPNHTPKQPNQPKRTLQTQAISICFTMPPSVQSLFVFNLNTKLHDWDGFHISCV